MELDELLETGKIQAIGAIVFNDDLCPLYAHAASGDIFVYDSDNMAGFLMDEVGCSDDMLFGVDRAVIGQHTLDTAKDGQIGAIALKDGTFIDILAVGEDEVICDDPRNGGVQYSSDFLLEVVLEEYA